MESIKKRVLYSSLNDNMYVLCVQKNDIGFLYCFQEASIVLYWQRSPALFFLKNMWLNWSISPLITPITTLLIEEQHVSCWKWFYMLVNSYIDLKQQFPNREFRFVCVDISLNEFFKYERHIMTLIYVYFFFLMKMR